MAGPRRGWDSLVSVHESAGGVIGDLRQDQQVVAAEAVAALPQLPGPVINGWALGLTGVVIRLTRRGCLQRHYL